MTDDSNIKSTVAQDDINICILGMGYVGLTSGAVFAKNGYTTICTDTIASKVEDLNNGITPFFEPGLDEIVTEVLQQGTLKASTNNIEAIKKSNITLICVGTPSLPDGSANLTYVGAATKDIGTALKEIDNYHVVVVKSTVVPGTTEETVIPLLQEYSGKKVGEDFGLCMNPEFLRQGSAVHDTINPDRIIIGQLDQRSGDMLERLYHFYNCPKLHCDIKAAELIKYAANALLATKISFANEFSRICEKFNIDVYEVMKGVGLDFRINPQFLNAGCGFGGSCFPKDVKAIVALAKKINVETPILDSVLHTNELQPMHLIDIIRTATGGIKDKTFSFLGLSFKPDTDDTRETRALPIIQKLYAEGGRIKAYDPKAYDKFKSLTELPIEYTLSIEEALTDTDACIIQSDWQQFRKLKPEDFTRLMKTPIIIDGRRTFESPEEFKKHGIKYYGIGWKNKD